MSDTMTIPPPPDGSGIVMPQATIPPPPDGSGIVMPQDHSPPPADAVVEQPKPLAVPEPAAQAIPDVPAAPTQHSAGESFTPNRSIPMTDEEMAALPPVHARMSMTPEGLQEHFIKASNEEANRLAAPEKDQVYSHKYGTRKPEEYEAFAQAIAKRLGGESNPEFVKAVKSTLDAFDLAHSDLSDPSAVPKELRNDVLAASQYVNQERDKKNDDNWAMRTVGSGIGQLAQAGQSIKRLNPFQSKDDWEWEQHLLDVATDPARFTHPDQGFVSRNAQAALAALPKMGAAALAGGTPGVAAMFGLPAAVNVEQAAKARGATGVAAMGAGVAAGALETALFSALPAKIIGQFGGEAVVSQTIRESAQRYALDILKTGGILTASGLKSRLAEEGAVRISGKKGKSAGELWRETVAELPDTVMQAALLHSVGHVRDVAGLPSKPSRLQFEKATGAKGTSASERQALVEAARKVQQSSPPGQPPPMPGSQPPSPPTKTFKFEAMDEQGNEYADTIPANSEEEALQAIKDAGYIPTKIKEQSNAQQVQKTSPNDGGSGPQPILRQEGGNPPKGSQGVQPSGRGDGNPQRQATEARSEEEAVVGKPEDRTPTAGVAPDETTPPPTPPPAEVPAAPAADAGRVSTTVAGVTARRAERGEEPVAAKSPETVEEWHAEAKRKMESDPTVGPRLVKELLETPRDISKVEVQILKRHAAQMESRLSETSAALVEAAKSGDDKAIAKAQREADAALDDVHAADKAARVKGQLWGQSGVSQQDEKSGDYSLSRRLTELSIAKGGEPLTPEEHATVVESTAEIARLTAELQAAQEANAKHEEKSRQDELDRQIELAKQEVAAKRRETIEGRIRRQFATAHEYGIDPDALESEAKERAKVEAELNREYNSAYRQVVKATGLSPAVIRDIENGRLWKNGKIVDIEEYHHLDGKAAQLARDFPELGLQPESDAEGVIETKDMAAAIVDLIKRGPRAVPEWYDKLDEVAQRLAAEKGKPLPDDFHFPWEGEGEVADGFEPSSTAPAESKPTEKASRKPVVPRKVRVAAARKAFDDAFASFVKAAAGKLYANPLDPELIVEATKLTRAAVELGIVHFSEFMATMRVSEFMATMRDRLGEKAEKARETFLAAWDTLRDEGSLPPAVHDATDMSEIGRLAKKLTRWTVESGIEDRKKVVDAVHAELKWIMPEITRRQTMDAMSGYGEFKELTKDETSIKVRVIKGELQQLAKLDDMRKGAAPKKTGIERREPSKKERRLIKLVNEAKKKGGFSVTDPAKQLKTALDSAKRAVRNRMADKAEELRTGKKIIKERTELKPDAELLALREADAALSEKHDAAFPKPPISDAKKAELAGKALDRSIAQLEADLKSGDVAPKPKDKPISTPALDAKRAQLAKLREKRDALRDAANPKLSPEEKSNLAYKRSLETRLADYKSRVARGNYAKKPIKKRVLTKEQDGLKYQIEQQKLKLRIMEATARSANRTGVEKAADLAGKVVRFNVLSYPSIFGKLTSMAASRILELPVRELSGGLSSWRHPEIAEKSPIHGGMDFRAVLDGYIGLVTGLKGSIKLLKGEESPLTTRVGKGRVEPRSWLDYPGKVHAAFKEPIKQMAFDYAKSKYMRWAAEHNIDITDPMVTMKIDSECYQHAERQIFMNDNAAAKRFREYFSARRNPKTGHATLLGKFAELIANTLVPIVTVPTNIVAECFEHVTGLVEGNVRARRAIRAGIADLEPAEADMIMRKLKNGNIGGAIALVAVLTGGAGIGAFYQHGKKYKDEDLQPGEVDIGGTHYKTHTIPTEVYEFFSTIGQVATSALSKKNPEKKGTGRGITAAILGLTEDVPFVREMFELNKLQQNPDDFLAELAKSRVLPGMLQQIANMDDEDESGKTIKRKPETFWQHLETGIPVLRENVPEKRLIKRKR